MDHKLKKLPRWAQELIMDLRNRIRLLESIPPWIEPATGNILFRTFVDTEDIPSTGICYAQITNDKHEVDAFPRARLYLINGAVSIVEIARKGSTYELPSFLGKTCEELSLWSQAGAGTTPERFHEIGINIDGYGSSTP